MNVGLASCFKSKKLKGTIRDNRGCLCCFLLAFELHRDPGERLGFPNLSHQCPAHLLSVFAPPYALTRLDAPDAWDPGGALSALPALQSTGAGAEWPDGSLWKEQEMIPGLHAGT